MSCIATEDLLAISFSSLLYMSPYILIANSCRSRGVDNILFSKLVLFFLELRLNSCNLGIVLCHRLEIAPILGPASLQSSPREPLALFLRRLHVGQVTFAVITPAVRRKLVVEERPSAATGVGTAAAVVVAATAAGVEDRHAALCFCGEAPPCHWQQCAVAEDARVWAPRCVRWECSS